MKTLLQLLTVLVGSYAIVCAVLFVFQDRLLYLPNIAGRSLVATPADIDLDYEDVHLETADGVELHGWLVHADDSRGTVLFFHGNAGNISHRLDSIRVFNRIGLSVLIIDYRGYGQSQGRPSEEGLYRDAEAAWYALVRDRGESPDRVVLFGRSLGGAVAAWLAARTEPAALILESTFTSVPELGQQLYPVFPVRRLARMNYDTRAQLQEVTAPVLVVHSPDDEIVPFSHAERLLEAAPEARELLRLRGGHNEGFLVSGRDYRDGLDRFVSRHLPPATASTGTVTPAAAGSVGSLRTHAPAHGD